MSYDVLPVLRKIFGSDYEIHYQKPKDITNRNYLFVTLAGREYRIDTGNLMVEGRGNKKHIFPPKFFVDSIRKELEKHFGVRQ
jgi:hypothetical protein